MTATANETKRANVHGTLNAVRAFRVFTVPVPASTDADPDVLGAITVHQSDGATPTSPARTIRQALQDEGFDAGDPDDGFRGALFVRLLPTAAINVYPAGALDNSPGGRPVALAAGVWSDWTRIVDGDRALALRAQAASATTCDVEVAIQE
jgi:hypothetical protein